MKSSHVVRPIHLYAEFENYPTPVLEEIRIAVIDRWSWDTGSEEDQQFIAKIENELDYRKRQQAAMEAISSAMQVFTDQHIDDMCRRLLEDVNYTEDEMREAFHLPIRYAGKDENE